MIRRSVLAVGSLLSFVVGCGGAPSSDDSASTEGAVVLAPAACVPGSPVLEGGKEIARAACVPSLATANTYLEVGKSYFAVRMKAPEAKRSASDAIVLVSRTFSGDAALEAGLAAFSLQVYQRHVAFSDDRTSVVVKDNEGHALATSAKYASAEAASDASARMTTAFQARDLSLAAPVATWSFEASAADGMAGGYAFGLSAGGQSLLVGLSAEPTVEASIAASRLAFEVGAMDRAELDGLSDRVVHDTCTGAAMIDANSDDLAGLSRHVALRALSYEEQGTVRKYVPVILAHGASDVHRVAEGAPFVTCEEAVKGARALVRTLDALPRVR